MNYVGTAAVREWKKWRVFVCVCWLWSRKRCGVPAFGLQFVRQAPTFAISSTKRKRSVLSDKLQSFSVWTAVKGKWTLRRNTALRRRRCQS
ncbi:hypothetical protein HPB48_024631 [Haemaphysalis longicornis]|uniref:Uncharacterized protein n=1 Tax=Haemaphysalis longicornis TaxID=44386 RepID=A0A9J6H9H5_HAELO|nr:hypothetical protein HPB48_024631 [Haemaphysalis longicornis]